MEEVSHLLSASAEADVRERPPKHVGEHPVRHDALVDLAHLPRACDDTAAIDDGPKAERRTVLLDEELGCELRRAVERPVAVEREILRDAQPAGSRHGAIVVELETGLRLAQRQRSQPVHGIDATRREKDELRVVASAELEAGVGAEEIRPDHPVEPAAVDARQDGRLGGALDDGVDRPHGQQVVRRPDVAVHEVHCLPHGVAAGSAPSRDAGGCRMR